ncbi:MAG: O-antigen ligase family protein [Candidatus Hydrogenedentes bacterium]|nr:O-antigen ligase family protein [Candidatus Hydrogenedentota bacterium]
MRDENLRVTQAGFRIQECLLHVIVLSLPWELFQRIPYTNVTLTKAASVLFILCSFVRCRPLEGKWAFRKLGVELPVLAFAAACGLSIIGSLDREATTRLLIMYLSYLVLFYAVAAHVRTAAHARRLMMVFAVSCGAVGLLAVACRVGLLYPTLVATSVPLGVRATPDMWDAVATRMAPAGEDFNQSVLSPLLAFVACAFVLFDQSSSKRVARIMALALFGSFAAIVVAISRTSIAICVAAVVLLVGASLLRRESRKKTLWFAVPFVAVLLAGAIVATPRLSERFSLLTGERDPSLEGRIVAYRAALSLAPNHLILGAGLGAENEAIAASPYAAQTKGMGIHNLPLKFLLELGIAGLIAYLWLWYAIARRLLLRTTDELQELWLHRRQFLGIATTVFLITMLMPFAALSLYPVMLALALGPLAMRGGPEELPAKPVWLAAGVLIMASVVTANLVNYQQLTGDAEQWCDGLHRGAQAEREGRYVDAAAHYASAKKYDGSAQRESLWRRAAAVFDYPFIRDEMGLLRDPNRLSLVCSFGLGRAKLLANDSRAAAVELQYVYMADPNFTESCNVLADALWSLGSFADSVRTYAWARTIAERTEPMRPIVDAENARIETLMSSSATDDRLFAARLLRRIGRWDEARAIYSEVIVWEPANAEALYHLGIAAEIDGNTLAATEFYDKAVQSAPDQVGAAMRLELLAKSPDIAATHPPTGGFLP